MLTLRDGPAAFPQLVGLGISDEDVAAHLACLRGCGLVAAVPHGESMYYELADTRLAHALGDLLDTPATGDPATCCDAETQL